LRTDNTGGVTGWCLDIHDLIAGKYVSAREKDFEFARMAIKQGLVTGQVLRERVEMLDIEASQKEGILNRVNSDFNIPPDSLS
jgi:hypothetical protein